MTRFQIGTVEGNSPSFVSRLLKPRASDVFHDHGYDSDAASSMHLVLYAFSALFKEESLERAFFAYFDVY